MFSKSVLLLALFSAFYTLAVNPNKPLFGEASIWGKDRIALQSQHIPEIRSVISMYESMVPKDAKVGHIIPVGAWDYFLFGSNFSRRIVPLTNVTHVNLVEKIVEEGIDYLIVKDTLGARPFHDQRLIPVGGTGGWYRHTLFKVTEHSDAPMPSSTSTQVLSHKTVEGNVRQMKSIVRLDSCLQDNVGVAQAIGLPPWGVYSEAKNPIVYIGDHETHQLTVGFWTDAKKTVELEIDVEPGESNDDKAKVLTIVQQGELEEMSETNFQVHERTRLVHRVSLADGYNYFTVGTLSKKSNDRSLGKGVVDILRIRQIEIGCP